MQVFMRRLCLAVTGWLVLFALPSFADAQTTEGARGQSDFPALAATSAVPPGPPAPAPCDVCWTADLLLGLPTGVRVQHTLGEGGGRDWLVEGFAGLEAIFPVIGAGVRRRFTPMCGQWDALVISPGVDVYVLYNTFHDSGGWFSGGPSTFELVTADVEFVWQHRLSDHWAGNVGLKLGAGYGGNSNGRAVIIPVVDLFFGFRF